MAADTVTVEQVKNRWKQILDKDKQYRDISKVHIDLVERMESHPPQLELFELGEEATVTKLQQGTPLLEGQEDRLNLQYAVALFRSLLEWSGLGDAKKQFRKWGKQVTDAQIESVLRGWLKGDLEPFTQWSLSAELPQDMLYRVVQYSLLPTLHLYGEGLLPHKHVLDHWNKGYCPVCGDSAALGELREAERFRYLRCISCGADWPFKRIVCLDCGNDDHHTLHNYLIEDPKTGGKYQIDVCDECLSYIKVSNKLQPSSPAMLLLDDLSTAHLDMFAAEKGYYRGGKPEGPVQ